MKQVSRSGSTWLILLVLIVGASGAFRVAVADHSLWFDEQASVFFAEQPFRRLWSDWMLRETNPALYYSLLRAWMLAVGSSDLVIRLLSVIASLVAIVLIAATARRLYGERAGLIAAVLAALSGGQLYFAEQARGYIFVLCAAMIALDAVLIICGPEDEHRSRWRAAVAYVIAATAGVYLHTTMVLFPVIILLAAVIAAPRRFWRRPAPILTLFGADIVVAVASAWAIRTGLLQILYGGGNIEPIGRVGLRDGIAYVLQTISLAAFPSRIRYVMAGVIIIVAAWFAISDRRRYETRLLVAVAALAFVMFAAIGVFVPIVAPRTLFWVTAPLIVVTAGASAAIRSARWRWSLLAVLAALLATDLARLGPKLQSEDWNTPVARLAGSPGTLMLVEGESMALLQEDVCRRKLKRDRCPYDVIEVINARDHFDTWAHGLFTGTRLSVADLAGHIAGKTVFIFRKPPFHDLVDLLHHHGMAQGVAMTHAKLLGPMPAMVLR